MKTIIVVFGTVVDAVTDESGIYKSRVLSNGKRLVVSRADTVILSVYKRALSVGAPERGGQSWYHV